MHYTSKTHPVPANERRPYPCGCEYERRVYRDGSWRYIHYCNPNCRFHAHRVGGIRCGHVFVGFHASNQEIGRLIQAAA